MSAANASKVKMFKTVMVQVGSIGHDAQSHRFKSDVAELVSSIREVGILQPLLVNGSMKLLSGKRRLAAAIQTGIAEVPVHVLDSSNINEELATIDENLMQLPLNSIEYDEAMYRRKIIFEEKYPQTKQGVAGALKTEQPAFTTATAEKLDVSRKTVELAINRAKLATPKVKQAREEGLAPSKVNEIVTLDPLVQDEVLPLVKNKSYSEVKDLVRRIKENGLEETIRNMQAQVNTSPFFDGLDHELSRLQKELSGALSTPGRLNIRTNDKLVKKVKGVMRMMRTFLTRVKLETNQAAHPEAEAAQGLRTESPNKAAHQPDSLTG